MAGKKYRLPALFRSFGKSRAVFLLIIVIPVAASQAWAGRNLRPFVDDAGLFDPAQGPVKIGYQLLEDTDIVQVRVRNFKGQIVNNFNMVEFRAGDHVFSWDGENADGERLADGRYELLFRASFTDGSENIAVVDVRIATIEPAPAVQAPETLPPKEHAYRLKGSVSTFRRHNDDREKDNDAGEARLLADFSLKDENRQAEGVLSVLQPFYGGSTSYNGSRGLLEQRWHGGKVKGIFREGLGNFDDPMKLFSDFQSERKKTGLYLDHTAGDFDSRCLVFGTEGDVDSKEQGAAARMKYGNKERWQLGASYTFRDALMPDSYKTRSWNHAIATDFRIHIIESLALVMEMAHTSDSEKEGGDSYVATAVYDTGRLRFSGGYIDMGEDFTAPFADPLHHVTSDARGVDTSVDYSMVSPLWHLNNLAVTLGFYDLKRYSDESKVREIDASARFGVGRKDTFFLSWFGREEDFLSNQTIRGNAEHKWNELWSSRLQANHSFADLNRTWRFTLDATRREKKGYARLAAEWIKREIDTSRLSPFKEANLRFDWNREKWGLHLQTRHSRNRDDSGVNFFGRVEYKPVFFHRYRFLTYASVGNRAAFSFENQVEVGLEVSF